MGSCVFKQLDNGSWYKGEWKDGKPHGKGTLMEFYEFFPDKTKPK